MAKKVSDSQVAGIKAHAEAKNKATIDKVNKAISRQSPIFPQELVNLFFRNWVYFIAIHL